jgi:hypothetical protein
MPGDKLKLSILSPELSIDETPISAVRFTITVGEDSLGDTDILRHDVSADFAIVVLNDDTVFEVSLNEGAEWPAHTTHTREVPVDPGTLWGDVRVVRIRHEAAGSDHNADNWKMNEIVIASIATDGTENVQFRHRDTPIWEFKKNERQIWKQPFP